MGGQQSKSVDCDGHYGEVFSFPRPPPTFSVWSKILNPLISASRERCAEDSVTHSTECVKHDVKGCRTETRGGTDKEEGKVRSRRSGLENDLI